MPEVKVIGTVKSEKSRSGPHFPFHTPAEIHIKEEYVPALKNLEYNSHIWVICLYNPKNKEELQVSPRRVDHSLGLFGTLALRTPNHPNPLGLTLTKLLKVEGNIVYVERLDAFDGTPVIDIKPYYEYDIVPSPSLPDIRHSDPEQRQIALAERALNYHHDYCPGMALAVKMILALEAKGINPTDRKTILSVKGDACIADNLQGLCMARLENPPRFSYAPAEKTMVTWKYDNRTIEMTVKENISDDYDVLMTIPHQELIIVTDK